MYNELSKGKESKEHERTPPPILENNEIRETHEKLEKKEEKTRVRMETHKMCGQAGPNHPAGYEHDGYSRKPQIKKPLARARTNDNNCSAITGNQSRPEAPHVMKPKPNPEIRLPKI